MSPLTLYICSLGLEVVVSLAPLFCRPLSLAVAKVPSLPTRVDSQSTLIPGRFHHTPGALNAYHWDPTDVQLCTLHLAC